MGGTPPPGAEAEVKEGEEKLRVQTPAPSCDITESQRAAGMAWEGGRGMTCQVSVGEGDRRDARVVLLLLLLLPHTQKLCFEIRTERICIPEY